MNLNDKVYLIKDPDSIGTIVEIINDGEYLRVLWDNSNDEDVIYYNKLLKVE